MKLLNGSEIAAFVKERQAKQVRGLRQAWHTVPRLAVVQTVDNPVIDTYVRLKYQYAEDILVEFELHKVTQNEALNVIESLNNDDAVHGVIVQLPLADPSQTEELVNAVAPQKDVDGLGENPMFDPATPTAILWLLAAYNISPEKHHIAIVGNGRLVGKPLARIWAESGCDVTVFDENTPDIKTQLLQYSLIVTATGSPRIITSDMVRSNAIVIDAGTSAEHGVIVGDVDDSLRSRDDLMITPLIGGVGPLTIAALFENVISAARKTIPAEDL